MDIAVRRADLDDPLHQRAIVELIDMYASDPIGGGQPLGDDVRQQLVPELRARADGRHFLAFAGDTAVGIAICFVGFSTFRARPLLNIHDLAVRPEARGKGVGRALLEAVQREAASAGCCKITLEVRSDNLVARRLYLRFGFDPGQDGSSAMSFWTKDLG